MAESLRKISVSDYISHLLDVQDSFMLGIECNIMLFSTVKGRYLN